MDRTPKCPICKKTFTQKSSLVRHTKRCSPGPAPSLRQKSCRACTASKTKCDLLRPRCTRCEQRNTLCEYVVPMTRGTRIHDSQGEDEAMTVERQGELSSEDLITASDLASLNLVAPPLPAFSTSLDAGIGHSFTPLGFHDPLQISADPTFDDIAERYPQTSIWNDPASTTTLASTTPFLAPITPHDLYDTTMTLPDPLDTECTGHDWFLWLKGPTQDIPPLVRHSMETLLQVMKTWPRMLAKGFQTPPMLHFSHTDPKTVLPPMIRCIAIAKMWSNQNEGETEAVRHTIIQEMGTLFSTYHTLDERSLLSALQALTLYTTMLMYPGYHQLSISLVDPAIFLCLQKVVSYVAKTGLMLTEERDNVRPSWASWVHVTAKRRAIFSLYLLHWSYAVYHGLESFACSQLGFMPAPAPKFLWQAESRERWEELYDRWLEQWKGTPYMMREFAAMEAGTGLERRTEMWHEDADELGVLFFSIGTTVHPCVEWW